jgi:uncharacterized protein YndB with AHSA1/START domain
MTKRSATPATFTIERTFPISRDKVFRAYSDVKMKAKWFGGPEEWGRSEHKLDFRIGGRESVSGGPPGGPQHHYNGIHMDIVPDERIVLAYDVVVGETRLTVSLGSTEFKVDGKGPNAGTRLVYTEQIVFLDAPEHLEDRKKGTEALFDNLVAVLSKPH